MIEVIKKIKKFQGGVPGPGSVKNSMTAVAICQGFFPTISIK